jgi:hypothetical protein
MSYWSTLLILLFGLSAHSFEMCTRRSQDCRFSGPMSKSQPFKALADRRHHSKTRMLDLNLQFNRNDVEGRYFISVSPRCSARLKSPQC